MPIEIPDLGSELPIQPVVVGRHIVWLFPPSEEFLSPSSAKVSAMIFDTRGNTWSAVPRTGAAPNPGLSSAIVVAGSELLYWGVGQAGGCARLDPQTNTWRPISTRSAPFARPRLRAAWTGTQVFVWNGDRGSLYDPKRDTWSPTASAGQPSAGLPKVVAWTGSEIIVWGNITARKLDGARYEPLKNAWFAMAPMPATTVSPIYTEAFIDSGFLVVQARGGSWVL
ncbi:MAG: hypothetical protein IPG96_07710 [Proteobacteria bacterium]|nr:hypothetical protein [Pseudomonadota bacterium]